MYRLLVLLSIPLVFQLRGQTIVPFAGPEGSEFNREALQSRLAKPKKSDHRNAPVFTGDTVIPHFVDGASWSTEVTLTNLESRQVHANVWFLDDNGRDLYVPITGISPSARMVSVTLSPMASITFSTPGTSATLAQGYAYIDADVYGDCITGFAIFRQRVAGRPDFEAIVPIGSEFDSRFVLLYDNTNSRSTGFAIVNDDVKSESISVTIRDSNGTVLQQTTLQLGAMAHLAADLKTYYPLTANRSGLIEFSTTGWGATVLGLRFNPTGAFTSFHTLENVDWALGSTQ